jgi:hypothetical protein
MRCPDLLCRTGDLLLPLSVRRVLETYWIGDDRSLVYVTNWTFLHVLSGVLVVLWNPSITYLLAFWIHTAWEAWQILVRNTPWWTLRGQIDVVVDTLAYMLGVWSTKSLSI